MTYSTFELMVARAARELKDGDVVLVGIGIPNLAVNLAKRLHAPGICMIYESGAVDARPARLPLSIGDPTLVAGAACAASMFDVFNLYLQGGRIDVGFLGAAQMDRFGNINTTVVGDYARPTVRLPGSGGACEIASLARRVVVVVPHKRRNFPERVDFVTSPGYLHGGDERRRLGIPGQGPDTVITDLGVLKCDPDSREMILTSLHPGVSREQVLAETGWELEFSEPLPETPPPDEEELKIIRELTRG